MNFFVKNNFLEREKTNEKKKWKVMKILWNEKKTSLKKYHSKKKIQLSNCQFL